MIRAPYSRLLFWRVTGLANAFLYHSTRHRLLSATIAGWLKFLSLMLFVAALLLRWPPIWFFVTLGLAIGLRLLYWRAKRAGYITFVPTPEIQLPDDARPLPDNQKVNVRATGLFSVSDREAYLLQHPAQYWRVPLGDHTIMVQQAPGRYLYQFVQSGALRGVESGHLIYGRRPAKALAVTFLTTWGPQAPGEQITLYSNSTNHSAGKLEHKIILTFADDEDKHSVWNNLLRDRARVR